MKLGFERRVGLKLAWNELFCPDGEDWRERHRQSLSPTDVFNGPSALWLIAVAGGVLNHVNGLISSTRSCKGGWNGYKSDYAALSLSRYLSPF